MVSVIGRHLLSLKVLFNFYNQNLSVFYNIFLCKRSATAPRKYLSTHLLESVHKEKVEPYLFRDTSGYGGADQVNPSL